jgi:hypothetical protein
MMKPDPKIAETSGPYRVDVLCIPSTSTTPCLELAYTEVASSPEDWELCIVVLSLLALEVAAEELRYNHVNVLEAVATTITTTIINAKIFL